MPPKANPMVSTQLQVPSDHRSRIRALSIVRVVSTASVFRDAVRAALPALEAEKATELKELNNALDELTETPEERDALLEHMSSLRLGIESLYGPDNTWKLP